MNLMALGVRSHLLKSVSARSISRPSTVASGGNSGSLFTGQMSVHRSGGYGGGLGCTYGPPGPGMNTSSVK